MDQRVEYLTAETERGCEAIGEVMGRSYTAPIDDSHVDWALVRIVDGTPVSFILVDPDSQTECTGGSIPTGFATDAATRWDRRREGHFSAIVREMESRLRASGRPLMATHGEDRLYHGLGFCVVTHNFGVFVRPECIERTLGQAADTRGSEFLTLWEHPMMKTDRLVFEGVTARTYEESRAALQASAALARESDRSGIVFISPGEPFPAWPSLETPFTILARACGGEIRVQGSEPLGRAVEHANWVRVLDSRMYLAAIAEGLNSLDVPFPEGAVPFAIDGALITLVSLDGRISVTDGSATDAPTVVWPSSALLQLTTGYLTADALCALHGTSLPPDALDLLTALFPRTWRFTMDESWVF